MSNLETTLNNIDTKMDNLDEALICRNSNAAMVASVEMRILLASAMDQVNQSNGDKA